MTKVFFSKRALRFPQALHVHVASGNEFNGTEHMLTTGNSEQVKDYDPVNLLAETATEQWHH